MHFYLVRSASLCQVVVVPGRQPNSRKSVSQDQLWELGAIGNRPVIPAVFLSPVRTLRARNRPREASAEGAIHHWACESRTGPRGTAHGVTQAPPPQISSRLK